MSTGFEFEMQGLEGLEESLKKAIDKCPAEAEKTLKKVANRFKKSAKELAENELGHSEKKNRDESKALNAKWGTRLIGEKQGATALVFNSARHFHLIEDGHNLVKKGRTIGFVPGKHIMERTRNEYRNIVPEEFRKMADRILQESGLD